MTQKLKTVETVRRESYTLNKKSAVTFGSFANIEQSIEYALFSIYARDG